MRKVTWAVLLCLGITSCYHFPTRDAQLQKDLIYLKVHGHSPDDVDLPHHAWLALLLDIVPIPLGIGDYYIGDITTGLKGSLLFWLLYPMFLGPPRAYAEATYENDVYFVAWGHSHGWFDGKDEPASGGAKTSTTSSVAAVASDTKTVCPFCGVKYADPTSSTCPACGAKR